MSYIDATFDRDKNVIKVVERINGQRYYKNYPVDYHFYVSDSSGTFTSVTGEKLSKLTPKTAEEHKKMVTMMSNKRLWESDINPLSRCLEQHYPNADSPDLNIAFFDIESDFDDEAGYSSSEDAFNPITSIAVYLRWLDQMICLSVPPSGMDWKTAQDHAESVKTGSVLLFKNEQQMLETFLTLIEDADVLCGWNSESYDIPYIVNRVIMQLGKHEARKFCLWSEPPQRKSFEKGGKEQISYAFKGRISLDYLELYKKYTYEQKLSYALDYICELEINERKVPYEGSLTSLYKDNYTKFLEYNIQDAWLLERLDRKLQYIDLLNTIAHSNNVLISAAMGAVAVTDQAIILEAHKKGLVVFNKNKDNDEMKAAGGWVNCAKKGLQEWIGSVDLKSLYPSVIRTLNMSPETIVGQLVLNETNASIKAWEASGKKFADWWNNRFCTIEMERFFSRENFTQMELLLSDGTKTNVTGAELYDFVFNSGQKWCISANGTIFNLEKEGIIPSLLTRWYNERQELDNAKENYESLKDSEKNAGIIIPSDLITNDDVKTDYEFANPYKLNTCFSKKELLNILETADKNKIIHYFSKHKLCLKNNKVIYQDQKELEKIIGFWDKRQLVKKINLNSVYGGLLNIHCRFYRHEIGQSTTLTGRSISRHMASKINELITGEYSLTAPAYIYSDTDSAYFSAYPVLKDEIENGSVEWTKETVIDLYDKIAKEMNSTFPEYLEKDFNVPEERSLGVISATRETVSTKGLFIKKKRYALMVYDVKKKRKDINGKPGELKIQGLEEKRSDTPKVIQEFLHEVIVSVLTGSTEAQTIEQIREFKKGFETLKPWQKGTPKSVNNLTKYKDKIEEHMNAKLKGISVPNLRIPGHVQASLNWNYLRELNNDYHSLKIVDGQKVVVCKLIETTANKFSSIAYPIDESRLPDWFTVLPFDDEEMSVTIVDKKVENLLGVLNWDLGKTTKEFEVLESLFDFGDQ